MIVGRNLLLHRQMVESGGGSGVSDSLEVNLGSMGETQIIAPLSHFSSRGMT